jgi:hypothetical protein
VLQRFRRDGAPYETSDKLFEYFLMDVAMDSCMKTSRIRHALSSVQLFVERCLMNLETEVEPATLDARQWEWMRRYRVWEANRKVFLWPENWLEPELRDRQSEIYKETVSELLQSDLTEDAAATALAGYLARLDEIARLEPCGMFYEGAENVHVVARTSGAGRKYFYRRCSPAGWLPWEVIKLDIEDNPVLPYVWKGRLLLFWLKLLKRPVTSTVTANKPAEELTASDLGAAPRIEIDVVLCWSEHYNGRWQPARTSSVDAPATLRAVVAGQVGWSGPGEPPTIPVFGGPARIDPAAFRHSELRLGAVAHDDALSIVVSTAANGAVTIDTHVCSFTFHGTHGMPEPDDELPQVEIGNRRLVDSAERLSVEPEPIGNIAPSPHDVLVPTFSTRTIVIEPLHGLHDWNAPFLYADGRSVFYVTPSHEPMPKYYGPSMTRTIDVARIREVMATAVTHGISEDAQMHALAGGRPISYAGVRIGATGGDR